jgi:Response regulator containing a CheY-like receiver domain and an HTH DNA-binding domain
MYQSRKLPWEKMHEFLLVSGSARDPKNLCIEIVKNIYQFVPYDQARIYFLNDNGKIYSEVLFGVEKRWSKAYLEYFSLFENGRYGAANNLDMRYKYDGSIREWDTYELDEFIVDYIKPQGLRYSTGFSLYDADYSRKCVFALDRTKANKYTAEEIDIMSVLQPQLDNLHQNLFVLPPSSEAYQSQIDEEMPLTRREAEVTRLLCDGVTPANIGKKLSLSVSTVYRHIANIHNKLQVSSRQELIVKMLHRSK